jgi:16S rRNA C967 or C1407 C5-methylase (RsmB/RsmF family)
MLIDDSDADDVVVAPDASDNRFVRLAALAARLGMLAAAAAAADDADVT